MRTALVIVSTVLLAGCATTRQAPPLPAGTFWGYTADALLGDSTLVVTTDQGVCENARDAHMKRATGIPTKCRALTLAPGSDFWIVPAVNLPAGGYWGSHSRARCEEVERLWLGDVAISTRTCQPVSVRFQP